MATDPDPGSDTGDADDAGDPSADGQGSAQGSDEASGVVLRLPHDLRAAFKEPMGPVYTDADGLLAAAGHPVVAVGDVVTYHLREAGHEPALAVVDGLTERRRTDPEVRQLVADRDPEVWNPAATLTADLLVAMRDALADHRARTLVVDGEEDLATLPAALLAPDGASVVYGQPGEGMVHLRVDAETREHVYGLVERMDGDHDRFRRLLGIDP
jgi:uncharacterized protein (UPF0218 family)